ncbi:MAG: PD-(D/E)XK nuclease family protein [Gammaproteobacteria bacterium]
MPQPIPPTIRFEETGHRYWINGQLVPSVTQVLDTGAFDRVPAGILERAKLFGTAVHKAIELWTQDDLDMESLDPALKPYLDQFIKWMNESPVRIHLVEQRIGSVRYGVAGTVDLFCFYNRKPLIVDIKTGVPSPTHALQTAAYAQIWKDHFDLPPKTHIGRAALYLSADDYKEVRQSSPGDFNDFQAFLIVHRYKEKMQ